MEQDFRNVDYRRMAFWIEETSSIVITHGEEEKRYMLHEATSEEIFDRRLQNIPTFVLKVNDALFVTDIPKKTNLTRNMQPLNPEHMCRDCMHCRALSRELGGCEKVRDRSFEAYTEMGNELWDAVDLSKRIEKYKFIRYGYETFGTTYEVFVVNRCKYFKTIPPMKRNAYSKEAMDLKDSIAKYYYTH